MKRIFLGIILLILFTGIAWAVRKSTAPPIYYLMDYGPNHLDNPKYFENIKYLPPELLHLGKDVPMTHLYGPIVALGGENQAHGRNRADIRRLTPSEVRERIAKLQKFTSELHHAGVKLVVPYISAVTFAGNPQTREGFFDFYDHWDEYKEFGIGSKPSDDPEKWAALNAEGNFLTFGRELSPPYYAGLNRYVACIEHPAWQHWLKQVVRLIAEVGYDGVFVDNSIAYNCYAPSCQLAFQRYLTKKYKLEELEMLFGYRNIKEIKLPTKRQGLLWIEACQFWQTSLANILGTLRAVGRKVTPNFILFANCGSPIHSAEYLAGSVNYIMLEGTGKGKEGAGYTGPHAGPMEQVIDNILEYRYIADLPGDIRPILLKLGRTSSSQNLSLAEAAAFGSGAYISIFFKSLETQRPMIQFLLRHKTLFEKKVSASKIALLFFPMRTYFPNDRHWQAIWRLKNILAELQIPFDCFSETGFQLSLLKTYKICFLPEIMYISMEHLKVLREYVASGGRLIILGNFANFDERLRPLPKQDWLPKRGEKRQFGKGVSVWLEFIPTRSELIKLFSPEGNLRMVTGNNGRLSWPMLRTMLYEGTNEYIVHLLNYGCPIEPEDGENLPLKEVSVRVPLPSGVKVRKVTCFMPDREEMNLSFEIKANACQFIVPEIPIYSICRVEFQ